MISIDFGNSYTKVSIRVNDNEDSRSVTDPSLEFDEFNICIPTVAAVLNDSWYYGVDVRKVGAASGVKTYRNWKPLFFDKQTVQSESGTALRPADAETDRMMRYRAYLSSAIADLHADVRAVRTYAQWCDDSRKSDDVGERYMDIALGFFKWLRDFVGPIGRRLGISDMSSHPTRIMLPNFGNQTAAREQLVRILRDAGWAPASHCPAVPEPLANIIGVSTGGKNRVWEPQPGVITPTYFGMFEGSPLFNAIRNYHLGTGKRRYYWMMAVDLGGYTTDFGMVGFDLDDIELPIEGEIAGLKRLATISYPHGVQMLDNQVLQVLREDKALHFKTLLNDPDQHRLETLHRKIYQQGSEYTAGTGEKKMVFREGAEGAEIDKCVESFAADIADKAEVFLEMNQYREVDCVVFTGGGFHVPLIRDVVCSRIEKYSPKDHRTLAYVSANDMTGLPAYWQSIAQAFVRGATATGGASVWFESSADAWSKA